MHKLPSIVQLLQRPNRSLSSKMSQLPLFSRSWWDYTDYPFRLMDQYFGMGPDYGLDEADLLAPAPYSDPQLRPKTQLSLERFGKSEVVNDKESFRVMLNVGHFNPQEIIIKIVGNSVVVHGKHEEKTDEHGFIAREFTRRYLLPDGAEAETVTSSLTPDGLLVIEAPKKAIEPQPVNKRVVPIKVVKADM